MTWLVWTGTILALIGLCGVILCIVLAVRAKRAGLDDAELRARLQRVVVLNMGALLVSALGLMAVVMGVILA
ncbi:hypothetical protein HKCCE2091_04300 [Rhodobacterales bacterium HKCCE2091]|nr:hypothetical protein [Rhodobacterales bacterium HKCCE2091]